MATLALASSKIGALMLFLPIISNGQQGMLPHRVRWRVWLLATNSSSGTLDSSKKSKPEHSNKQHNGFPSVAVVLAASVVMT